MFQNFNRNCFSSSPLKFEENDKCEYFVDSIDFLKPGTPRWNLFSNYEGSFKKKTFIFHIFRPRWSNNSIFQSIFIYFIPHTSYFLMCISLHMSTTMLIIDSFRLSLVKKVKRLSNWDSVEIFMDCFYELKTKLYSRHRQMPGITPNT